MDGGSSVAEREALEAFARWLAPRARLQAVQPRVHVSFVKAARLESHIVERSARRREVPCSTDDGAPAMRSMPAVDLFGVTPTELVARTRHVETCGRCEGKGKAACVTCDGSHRTTCDSCRGSGRARSAKTGNDINCPRCRGTGARACSACPRSGITTCSRCDGHKQVLAWLELSEQQRTVSHVAAERGVPEPAFVDAEILEQVSSDTVDPSSVSAEHREWLESQWAGLKPLKGDDERIAKQSLAIASVPVATVTYRVGERSGAAVFAGKRMILVSGDTSPFVRVASWMHGAYVVGAILLACLAFQYLARGGYFLSKPVAGVLGLSAAALGAACLLIRAALWGRRLLPMAATAGVLCAGAIGLAVVAEPSRAHAQTLLARNDLGNAEEEIGALGTPRDIADDLINRKLIRTPDLGEARRLAALVAPRNELTPNAAQHLLDLRLAALEAAVVGSKVSAANALYDELAPAERKHPKAAAARRTLLLKRAHECTASDDASCVDSTISALRAEQFSADAEAVSTSLVSSLHGHAEREDSLARAEGSASERLIHIEKADVLWAEWSRRSARHVPGADQRIALEDQTRKEIERERVAAAHRAAAEQKERERREKLEQKRLEGEARAVAAAELKAERQEAARQRRYNNAPLVCNDGSLSPSCTCGRSSYRGCCSHHSGVSGCSAD